MKKALLGALKVVVPLALGVYLIWYFYNALGPDQKKELFSAFAEADKRWLWLSLVVGWLSHVSRAFRWQYLLEPMGYRPGFWNRYHAVMIGYFMNLLLPRAGEASRAVSLYRTEGVPFEKGFGTILAERVVDMFILLSIAGVTMLLQLEKLDLFKERIASFREGQGGEEGGSWGLWILGVICLLALVGAYILFTRPALRARLMDTLRGFGEGLRSVLSTKNKGGFLLHTAIIWGCYLGMFALGFPCLESTAHIPVAGILAGFVAGAIGIVLVQGGIGVYPAFVALIISVYMASPAGGGIIHPQALAIGWLLWSVQTVLLIALGGLSLLLVARKKTPA